MLARLARFSFRRRRMMVFAIWLPLLVVLNVASRAVGSDYRTEFGEFDSESHSVREVLEQVGSAEDAGFTAQIVFTAEQGNDAPEVVAAMTAFLEKVDEVEGVKVRSPYAPENIQQNSPLESPANTSGADVSFAQLNITMRSQDELEPTADEIRDLGENVIVPGLTIEYGGQVFEDLEFPASEVLGILAAILILLVAFGSVVAMGLPIGTALIGLGIAMSSVVLASRWVHIPEAGPQVAAMIGLGVGIDYALFIVTRFREHLHMGEDPETATVAAVNSAGRAVMFAGSTVIISLLGLFLMGLSFVRGIAVAGAVGVLVMMVASVTLLPALLGFAAQRIDNTSRAAAIGVGLFVACGLAGVALDEVGFMLLLGVAWAFAMVAISYLPFARGLRRTLPHRHEKNREERFWYRWSRFIQHRPWPFFTAGVTVLVLLGLPLFSLRLGFGDGGNLPEESTVRRAYDLIADSFGPGSNGPLFLVSTDPGADATSIAAVDAALAADAEVALATPGMQISPDTWVWQVYPRGAPQDESTEQLVQRLRGDSLDETGIEVLVGGWTAGGIDFSTYIGARMPYLIGTVLLLSFILLMAVFRSILVPLKAVIMNLLSVGAAYGFVVAVFQWGWGLGLLGLDRAGPVEPWAPMMLFAIVFGLSMDYEVFLLSRIKEEYDRTGENATAVADGLAATARVITAAALIMVCVFSAFVLGDERSIKLFGLGMAVAVLVDATVVRMVLVPATMELLGARNWWLPKWLDRFLPHINVEGYFPDAEVSPPPTSGISP